MVGTVTARSEGLGRDSEFIVRIPANASTVHTALDLEPISAHPVLGEAPERRILIVDDDVDAAESIAILLQASGFAVRCVYDGASALSVATTYKQSVIVLDIGLPDIT